MRSFRKKPVVIGVGELLWDILPKGRHLGGAPANFAFHSAQLGCMGIVLSRVGNDELGQEALQKCLDMGLVTDYIQIDGNHPTGTVNVTVDEAGQPSYDIVEDVAWDFIEWRHDMGALAQHADIICFGTLAQRNTKSQKTIRKFLTCAGPKTIKIFDVNLRGSYYDRETLVEGFSQAHIVKLNDSEFETVLSIIKPDVDVSSQLAKDLLEAFGFMLLCITRGNKGCTLITPSKVVECPAEGVKIADTVGAGDAFTAALAINFMCGSTLEVTAKAANLLGGFVASQKGATPQISKKILKQINPIT